MGQKRRSEIVQVSKREGGVVGNIKGGKNLEVFSSFETQIIMSVETFNI